MATQKGFGLTRCHICIEMGHFGVSLIKKNAWSCSLTENWCFYTDSVSKVVRCSLIKSAYTVDSKLCSLPQRIDLSTFPELDNNSVRNSKYIKAIDWSSYKTTIV